MQNYAMNHIIAYTVISLVLLSIINSIVCLSISISPNLIILCHVLAHTMTNRNSNNLMNKSISIFHTQQQRTINTSSNISFNLHIQDIQGITYYSPGFFIHQWLFVFGIYIPFAICGSFLCILVIMLTINNENTEKKIFALILICIFAIYVLWIIVGCFYVFGNYIKEECKYKNGYMIFSYWWMYFICTLHIFLCGVCIFSCILIITKARLSKCCISNQN